MVHKTKRNFGLATVLVGIIGFALGILISVVVFSYRDGISRVISLDVPGRMTFDASGRAVKLILPEDNPGVLMLERGNVQHMISMEPLSIEKGMVISPCGSYAFWVVTNRKSKERSIVKLRIPHDDEALLKYNPTKVLSEKELASKLNTNNAWPDSVIAASDSGSRLLINVSIVVRRRPTGNQHRIDRPFILSVSDGVLMRIEP